MSLHQAGVHPFTIKHSRSRPQAPSAVYKAPRHHCHKRLHFHQEPPTALHSSHSHVVVVPRSTAGNGSTGNGSSDSSSGSGTGGSSSTNGSSPSAAPSGPSSNGGGSSGGGGSTRLQTGQGPSDDGQNGQHQQAGFQLPLSSEQLSRAVIGLGAVSALLLVALVRQAALLSALASTSQTVVASLGDMADGQSTRDSVAALKRLLREVFAEQLSIKQRLTDAEKAAAAAAQLEAADDFQLQRAVSAGSCWSRAPGRMSGHITASGVLPWTQEASDADALSMLSSLGVAGAADAVLQLHSVLSGGKRRITAEFCQAARDGSAAALKLQTLLFRVQARSWLQLMIAPLGGGLEVLGRSITPVRGDYGCTQALRKGHGLTMLQQLGSGKAISLAHRSLSASAGLFVGESSRTAVAHLQARRQDGHSLSLLASHSRQQAAGATPCADLSSSTNSTSTNPTGAGMRFLGVQSPHRTAAVSRQQATSGGVLGAAGVVPIGDTLTATAWGEKPLLGRAGWGAALYCQPDQDGVELGLAVGKASAGDRDTARALFCEVSAKVPAGEGLSISPCAVYTFRSGASSLAYVMQSCWRF